MGPEVSTDYKVKFPTDPAKRYARLLKSFTELQAAAQKVVDEIDRTHDGDPWPIKYRAPYGAITELRKLLLSNYGLRVTPGEEVK